MPLSEHAERWPLGFDQRDGRDGQDGGREEAHGEPGTCGEVRGLGDAYSAGLSERRSNGGVQQTTMGADEGQAAFGSGYGLGYPALDGCGEERSFPARRSKRDRAQGAAELSWAGYWLDCLDGKARRISFESEFFKVVNGFSDRMGYSSPRRENESETLNADAKKIGSGEELQRMRKIANKEAFLDGRFGRPGMLSASQVLRSNLHGSKYGGKDQDSKRQEWPTTSSEDSERSLRTMWKTEEPALCSPSGRESSEQQLDEFDDVMRLLSSSYSLAKLRRDTTTAETVFRVFEAGGTAWLLQYSSHQIQEAWRSIPSVARERIVATFGSSGLLRISEFPLSSNNEINRVGRLRGYGNAIVPQVAAEFVRAFAEIADIPPLVRF